MPGTIPLSMTQQFDEFGKPLSGGLLYIYQAGSVATPQNPYQDYGLTILQPNPIPLDAAGRIPMFYLADGFVKIRLVDKLGVTQVAKDFVLVIGPSSGAAAGAGVDPTTILQTGMIALFYGTTAVVTGYVRANGRSIGNALSGATERAHATDTSALFTYLYGQDANLVLRDSSQNVVARTNAANDFNVLNRNLALPDWRGRVIGGLDDMGNTAAARLTAAIFGMSPLVLGAVGGLETNTLAAANYQLPQHQHDVFLKEVAHSHGLGPPSGILRYTPPATAGGGGTIASTSSISSTEPALTGMTIGSVNGVANDNKTAQNPASAAATPHANVQPTMLTTIYVKL